MSVTNSIGPIIRNEKTADRRPNLTSLEVLVVQTGGIWLAVRATRVGRLRRYNPSDVIPSETTSIPAFLGIIGSLGLPLLNLATLLDLESESLGQEAQVLVMEHDGLAAGFVVEVAQEIERAELQTLRLLPPLIEELRLKPAIWALWQRTPETLIPLVEPLSILTEAEWQLVMGTTNSSNPIQTEQQ